MIVHNLISPSKDWAYTSKLMDLKRDPVAWSNRGAYVEVLQELKLLWNVLVKYGKPTAGR